MPPPTWTFRPAAAPLEVELALEPPEPPLGPPLLLPPVELEPEPEPEPLPVGEPRELVEPAERVAVIMPAAGVPAAAPPAEDARTPEDVP